MSLSSSPLVARLTRPGMSTFLLRRVIQAAIVMFLVVSANFLVLQLAPGDLVDVLAGKAEMTAEQMAEMRARYGLDQPALIQYVNYLWQLAQLDLGWSARNNLPVLDVLLQRVPITLSLMVASSILSVLIGTLMGVAAAKHAGKWPDSLVSGVALLLYATPAFIVSILLILIFGVWLNWLPISGLKTIGSRATGLAHLWDLVVHMILPVMAICAFYIAIYVRMARSSLLEVLNHDFVRTARAKGLSPRKVLYRHALRNALLPIVTMAGLQVSTLMGGAVLVESVFNLPGIGRTAFDSVANRDMPLLMGVTFLSSFAVVAVNLVVDLIYVALDPRVDLK